MRPMEGWYLRGALEKLAEISAIADSMRRSLTEPLTDDDIAAGAEPLTPEQMAPELERITLLTTSLALEELQATAVEWYAANDKIE